MAFFFISTCRYARVLPAFNVEASTKTSSPTFAPFKYLQIKEKRLYIHENRKMQYLMRQATHFVASYDRESPLVLLVINKCQSCVKCQPSTVTQTSSFLYKAIHENKSTYETCRSTVTPGDVTFSWVIMPKVDIISTIVAVIPPCNVPP